MREVEKLGISDTMFRKFVSKFFHSNRDFKKKENELKTIQSSCSPGRGIEKVKSLGQK